MSRVATSADDIIVDVDGIVQFDSCSVSVVLFLLLNGQSPQHIPSKQAIKQVSKKERNNDRIPEPS